MSLNHKTTTPKALAANRANARKSTGPRTAKGKRTATQHLVCHGVLAEELRHGMKEMGESPQEYERQREALYAAFAPEDGFEEMLVNDMAHLRWRWQRLMCAESGLIASRKRQYEIEREIKVCSRGGPHGLMVTVGIGQFGVAGLPDSVEKCQEMVKVLDCLRESVLLEGFREDHLKLFTMAYGKTEPVEGIELKTQYESCLKAAAAGETPENAERKKSFLAALDAERTGYVKLLELCRARDQETTRAMKDAHLLPEPEDLRMVLRYEAGLERQFRRKLRQLVAWRRAKRRLFVTSSAEESPVEAA